MLLALLLVNLLVFVVYVLRQGVTTAEAWQFGFRDGAFLYNGTRVGIEIISASGLAIVVIGAAFDYLRRVNSTKRTDAA